MKYIFIGFGLMFLLITTNALAELNEDTSVIIDNDRGYYGLTLPIQLESWQADQLVTLNDFIAYIQLYEGYSEIYFDEDNLGDITPEVIDYELSLLIREHNNAAARDQWGIWYPQYEVWMYTPEGDALPCSLQLFQGGYYIPICFPFEGNSNLRDEGTYLPPPNLQE